MVLGEENKYEQIYDVDVDKNRYVSVQKGSGCLARALNPNNRSQHLQVYDMSLL